MADRQLLSIDIEATGVDPAKDRIVTLAIVEACERWSSITYTVNPGMPIPPDATKCHGITDDMVKNCPPFSQYAHEIHERIRNSDLLGFNLTGFDIPILWEEFFRCGIDWDLSQTNVIDAGILFKKREERTLSAAVKFYCDRELDGAHDASNDARATIDVWQAMLARYSDLRTLDRKSQASASQYEEKRVDLAGKIIVGKDGRPTYNIGKAKGVAVVDDRGFGNWMLGKDFTANTKRVLRQILDAPVAVVDSDDEIPF